ncbi:hypothetical protein SAMN04487910_2842 [Aquimarina amphilecti]|uniref:Lipocalin-like domain-containing protein n=1 Tax=Aquimarina amphilecti TaxID=1038014 RepID=A0A1H7RR18_AQUAM|nr:hypothetical protein [Aquimarina amphilecti]SEL62730.1 hypothetical protein SAMN04487910_2842 [Aquimarina amphilecti]
MKHFAIFKKISLLVLFITTFSTFSQENNTDLQLLIGEWKLDMSPQDKTDSNFAMMRIDKINSKTVHGTFYREGVKIQEGRINTQLDVVYVSLISGDNSGSYNTSFYYKNGKLYGSTHAVDRGFLAVWIAEKTK